MEGVMLVKERQKIKEQQWDDSLPTYTPAEEENKAVAESIEAIKNGEMTEAIDPRDRKTLNKALGF